MTDRHPYRWVIFTAMAAVYYAFGAMVASIPPMVSTVRADLGISLKTVETHRARVMEKMAARSVSELVRMTLVIESQGKPLPI